MPLLEVIIISELQQAMEVLPPLAITLLAMMFLDFASGIVKAIYLRKLNSHVGYKGFLKKMSIIIVILVSKLISDMVELPLIVDTSIKFFIFNEGISILENISVTGLIIPKQLRDVLEQVKGGEDNET